MTFNRVAALLVDVDPAQVNTNTLISLGTVVILIGVAWRLSASLTRIDEKLERLEKVPGRVTRIEGQIREVVGHIKGLEEDVSILWTTQRGEPLDRVRRKTRRAWPEPEEEAEE